MTKLFLFKKKKSEIKEQVDNALAQNYQIKCCYCITTDLQGGKNTDGFPQHKDNYQGEI